MYYIPLPLVDGGSRLLSSLGSGEPPFEGTVRVGFLPNSSGCKSDTMLCVHKANSTICGDHFLPQPFCSCQIIFVYTTLYLKKIVGSYSFDFVEIKKKFCHYLYGKN